MRIPVTELAALAREKPGRYRCVLAKGRLGVRGLWEIGEEDYRECVRAEGAGLGDLVAMVAKPIAKVIDQVLGTDLEHCESCAERQVRLNELASFRVS